MRSRPNSKESYEVSHSNVIQMSDHVLMFGYNKDAVFLHFHFKGNLHPSHQDLIKQPPLDIIRLDPDAIRLFLERLVWADSSREIAGNAKKESSEGI